jgi:hypothetical protein
MPTSRVSTHISISLHTTGDRAVFKTLGIHGHHPAKPENTMENSNLEINRKLVALTGRKK